MSCSYGRAPSQAEVTHNVESSHVLFCLCVLFASLFLPAYAVAQYTSPLTLAEAESIALKDEPGRASLLAQADALGEQSVAAGQLPDPQLHFGMANFPLQSGGFTTEGMTQAQLGIRQSFPRGKRRDAAMRQFQSLAQELTDNAQGRSRDVLSAVRNDWLEAYYWSRADLIISESRPFFVDLVAVTRSLYAVGRKGQQDVLQAELELSRLDDRLIEINRQDASARAALSEWVGTAANRPFAQGLPVWPQVPELALLHQKLSTHPVIKAADARITARTAGVDVANENFKPGWALDLGYGFRNGSLANGDPRSDFVSLSVTVDLPVFRKNRQNRMLSAALSERRAATEARQANSRRLGSRLDAEYARWQHLGRRLELYQSRILTQVADQAQAAMAAYQSDAGDFSDVMRGYIDDLNTRLDYVHLQVKLAQSYAVLANIGGIER